MSNLNPILSNFASGGLKVVLTDPFFPSVGATVTDLSQTSVATTNQVLFTSATLYGLNNNQTSGFNRMSVTQSGAAISGVGYKLITDFSGAIATISGNSVVTSVSGNQVNTSGSVIFLGSSGFGIVGFQAQSVENTAAFAIPTYSMTAGWTDTLSALVRIRATTSGATVGLSGVQTKLVVDFSGANDIISAVDPVWNTISTLKATLSGDNNRLQVSTEGQAPTYSVNMQNVTLFSGGAAGGVAPLFALYHYGSGTSSASGARIKIKGIYVQPDANNNIVSGQPLKLDVVRISAFSGGGTNLSGVSHDTADPAWSGTVQPAPAIQSKAASGATLHGLLFSHIMTTQGFGVFASGAALFPYTTAYNLNANVGMVNLIKERMYDTREIIIYSGYGLAIQQSSGNSYTQVQSGIYAIQIVYSMG